MPPKKAKPVEPETVDQEAPTVEVPVAKEPPGQAKKAVACAVCGNPVLPAAVCVVDGWPQSMPAPQ